MAEWIEVPAHRIYVTSARELRADFDYIGENGRPATPGEIPYRFVRKKDGKVFKWARFAPQYIAKFITARRSKRYDFKELGDQRSYGSGAFWSLLPTPDKQQPLEVEIEFIESHECTRRWAEIFRILEALEREADRIASERFRRHGSP